MKLHHWSILTLAFFIGSVFGTIAQNVNTITTAVPFLRVAPDAQSGSMGFTGIATEPDVDATYWNAAKLVFSSQVSSLGVSYRPSVGSGYSTHLFYLNQYYKLRPRHTLGGSFRFFLVQGGLARELAADLGYSVLVTKGFSMGIALRYIYSRLGLGSGTPGVDYNQGQALAGDLSLFYTKPLSIKEHSANISWGLVISNVGSKISYSSVGGDFIPANLGTGAAFKFSVHPMHALSVALDLNKLLVPTNPSYLVDSNGSFVLDSHGKFIIDRGMDPNVSVIRGLYQSFYDAPGGFREEMSEISLSAGLEYCYAEKVALRMGYYYVPPTKGNQKSLTFGAGWKSDFLKIDFSFVVPATKVSTSVSTFYGTLHYMFDAKK